MEKVLYGFCETNITVVDGKACHRVDYFKGFDASSAAFVCTKEVPTEGIRDDAKHMANIHGVRIIRFMTV